MVYKVFMCTVCEKSETDCKCDRYCALCYSAYGIRLCDDGLYYCTDCREACDYKTQDRV